MANVLIPKWIYKWYLVGAILVISMVILGGYTRLSHSGLSIVYWKPITGILPPLNESAWANEFELYKSSPEFKLINQHFEISDFKKIFWPEYFHRLLGRLIGLVFIIPFLFLLVKGYLRNKELLKSVVLILVLGIIQGFAGWYMVKSGLINKPQVNHIRLLIHFTLALTLIGILYFYSLKFKNSIEKNRIEIIRYPKIFYSIFILLICQIFFGALVAGLKAGLFYPTFPYMGNTMIPQTVVNDFENHSFQAIINSPYVVQFVHRWLGILTFLLGATYLIILRKKTDIPKLNKAWTWVIFFMLIQIILGVLTLINLVPISLGVIHQLIAVILFCSTIRYYYLAKYNP